MRRMFDEKEIKKIAKAEAKPLLMENIEDEDRHKRFCEDNIEIKTGLSGITKSFAKWSLSGSHLMIVIAGSIANGTTFSYGALTENLTLPQWIKDKLVVSFGTASVSLDDIKLYASNLSTQEVRVFLVKSANSIYVVMDSITLTEDRNFRVEFDLLIDNE